MKISKRNLSMLIENLLLEETNKYKELIDEINDSSAIKKGLIKAYKYITSGKYNPEFLRDMPDKDREDFIDQLILELKKIVEVKQKIKFSDSEDKTDAYAHLGTFEKDGNIEFEIVLFVDNISKKGLAGNKLAKFIEDKIFHEFMHVENHFANLKNKFNKEAKGILITLEQLDQQFYKKRYNVFEKNALISFYKNELDPDTDRGVDEIRVRISQFKANNTLKDALEYSKKNKLSQIIEKYGDADAPWLFMVDYQNNSIEDLLRKTDDIAKQTNTRVQSFKT